MTDFLVIDFYLRGGQTVTKRIPLDDAYDFRTLVKGFGDLFKSESTDIRYVSSEDVGFIIPDMKDVTFIDFCVED